jgi:hypothetical protein
MAELTIATNNQWRNFKYRYEVPESVLKSDFDWMKKPYEDWGYEDSFIQYKKNWYHLSEFERIDKNSPFPKNWTGYSSDSFFSGILIQLSEDGEQYKIGWYYS